ncbi:hypothetical protein ACFL27_00650 [candidate division CSSED10-310 bacterium]|uniref:F5/8 type C domain-containing protein n=1 Tax=candidate division CSSED10-310 bacterium TaxID=2855610 RepID=A0ABV6YR55_UNCC1
MLEPVKKCYLYLLHKFEDSSIRLVDILIAGLYFGPFIILFVSYCAIKSSELFAWGDYAIIEMGVLQAEKGTRLVGLSSRFGFYHPGPFYFYLLAPFYKFLTHNGSALITGARFINLCAIVIILVVVYQNKHRFLFLATSFLVSFYVYTYSKTLFRNSWITIWTPLVTILPFWAFIFTASFLALGRLTYLPITTILASFLIQTHLGYTVTSMAILVSVLLLFFYHNHQNRRADREYFGLKRCLVYFLISFIIFLFLWFLPLYQELRDDPGNLTNIIRFFSDASETVHTYSEALAVMNKQALTTLNYFWHIFSAAELNVFIKTIFFIELFVLLVFLAVNAVFKHTFLSCLQSVCTVALLTALFSITHIRGEIYKYLIAWIAVIHYTAWGSIIYTILHLLYQISFLKFKKFFPYLNILLTIIFLIYGYAIVKNTYSEATEKIQIKSNPVIIDIVKTLEKSIAIQEPLPPKIFLEKNSWAEGTGLVCYFLKHNIPVDIQGSFKRQLGSNYHFAAPEKIHLHLKKELKISGLRGYMPICRSGASTLYYKDLALEKNFKNYLHQGPLKIAQSEGMKGNVAVIIDGDFLKAGAYWETPQTAIFKTEDSFVTIELPATRTKKILGLAVVLDGNDDFRIFGSNDNQEFTYITRLKGKNQFGMRPYFLLRHSIGNYRYIKLKPVAGDGWYSIGEIGFLTF